MEGAFITLGIAASIAWAILWPVVAIVDKEELVELRRAAISSGCASYVKSGDDFEFQWRPSP